MPKVSVLMTAYNSGKYIAQAIESILGQTFTDFEFIIINDGSTDNTANIVKLYAKQDKRIKFIDNKKNQGLIAVLNQGLDLCTGKYIARMDSDDIAINTRFEVQVKYMDENPNVGVVGGWHEKFGDDIKPQIRKYPLRVTLLDMLVFGTPISHPTAMIRTSVLRDNNIYYNPDFPHAEDYEIWAQIARVAPIHNIPMVMLRYRWHTTNVSVTAQQTQRDSANRIQRRIMGDLTCSAGMERQLKLMMGETISRFRLFGFLPIIRKKQYGITKTRYYLFGKIPLIRVQNDTVYLFEIIKLGKYK